MLFMITILLLQCLTIIIAKNNIKNMMDDIIFCAMKNQLPIQDVILKIISYFSLSIKYCNTYLIPI